ncbi:MAG: iron ABC transporter permease [Okeania sp. SIO2F4]|uniref:FecCD family ABC transporter permease n=1 Tax=Okeania sp. SIO2F4 TaxID=2607790 RepID=UPI00142BEE39|nr:iron ABC transporter permease [Okeania sp. SIO2F4]NES03236.1 iron ABC transporter permease [Okeania sp. SIO2F4]
MEKKSRVSQLPKQNSHSQRLLTTGLLISIFVLIICLLISITTGDAEIPLETVYKTFTAFDGSTNQLIIRTLRVPRSLIAMSVGASLAVAGSIMQGLTKNPLASPGILGINAGAALAVVSGGLIFGSDSANIYPTFGFFGAIVTALTVYWLGSLGQGGLHPVKLTIAGAAITALLSSLTTAILILDQNRLDQIRFWLAGSVAGKDFNVFLQVFPYLLVGLTIAFFLARQITLLTLGEDVAIGLGVQTVWVKVGATICVVILAGCSVSIAGAIGFIGLVVPHIARLLVGIDYRWIIPYAAILGSILLLLADIAARLLLKPIEIPVGIMTSLIGGPFFIYLALSKDFLQKSGNRE